MVQLAQTNNPISHKKCKIRPANGCLDAPMDTLEISPQGMTLFGFL
jgi:hypothetical protein